MSQKLAHALHAAASSTFETMFFMEVSDYELVKIAPEHSVVSVSIRLLTRPLKALRLTMDPEMLQEMAAVLFPDQCFTKEEVYLDLLSECINMLAGRLGPQINKSMPGDTLTLPSYNDVLDDLDQLNSMILRLRAESFNFYVELFWEDYSGLAS